MNIFLNIITFGLWGRYLEAKRIATEAVAIASRVQRYTPVRLFETSKGEYLNEIKRIVENEAFLYFLYDMEMKMLDKMIAGDVETNNQIIGILKGMDWMLKTMISCKLAYEALEKQE